MVILIGVVELIAGEAPLRGLAGIEIGADMVHLCAGAIMVAVGRACGHTA